jgi:hypothetical protein
LFLLHFLPWSQKSILWTQPGQYSHIRIADVLVKVNDIVTNNSAQSMIANEIYSPASNQVKTNISGVHKNRVDDIFVLQVRPYKLQWATPHILNNKQRSVPEPMKFEVSEPHFVVASFYSISTAHATEVLAWWASEVHMATTQRAPPTYCACSSTVPVARHMRVDRGIVDQGPLLDVRHVIS